MSIPGLTAPTAKQRKNVENAEREAKEEMQRREDTAVAEQKRLEEVAVVEQKRHEEASAAEQKRLEEKYGLSPGELDQQNRTFELEKRREAALTGRAAKTGEELIEEQGQTTQSLLAKIRSRLGKTGEELFLEGGGAPAKSYFERVSRPVDTDVFNEELSLVRNMVNQEANRRGVFGGLPEGGIRFEQLGRAGVELAIKSARESLAQKSSLASTLINLSTGARGEAAVVGETALSESGKARNELDQFLAQQQQVSAQAQGRAAGVGLHAADIAEAGRSTASLAESRRHAADIAESGRNISYFTNQDIIGQKAGEARRAGEDTSQNLSRIIDLGGKIVMASNGIPPIPTGSGGSAIKTPEYSPGGITSLRTGGNLTDQNLQDEIYNIRKRRSR